MNLKNYYLICSLNFSANPNYLIFLVLISLHLIFLGVKVWFDVEKWLGYMPPISLLCFLIIIVIIFFIIRKSFITSKNDFNCR